MTKCFLVAALLAATIVPSTPVDAASSAIDVGAKHPLGAGHAWSWVRRNAQNAPVAFGLSFDEDALRGLGEKDQEIVLPLPSGIGLAYRTAVINWNAHGHPPAHVYDVPHLDFHFYTIDEATRIAIAPVGSRAKATPAAADVPAGFITDGATVPMMGKHYIPASAPEFHGGRFTATPIYGYYGGQPIFLESMVTLTALRGYVQYGAALPQPARQVIRGAHPTRWSVRHNAAAHRYDIAFEGLTS